MDPLMMSAAGLEAETATLTATDDTLANEQGVGFLALVAQNQAWDPQVLSRVTPGVTPIGGPLPEGVAATTSLRTAPSPVSLTGNPLNVAIPTTAFLVVQTPTGVAYTRSGALQVNPNGLLTTTAGDPVLDTAGQPIRVAPTARVTIAASGAVSAAGTVVATLGQATLAPPFTALGNGLYTGTATAVGTPVFVPGALNTGANQSLTTTLTDLVQAQNAYDANASVWQVANQVDQQASQLAHLP